MPHPPVIVWFRNDLRLAGNPALDDAVSSGAPVLSLYVLEEGVPRRPPGAASRWWLDKSLRALAGDVAGLGGRLILRRGDPRRILPELAATTGTRRVVWNRRYDRPGREIDDAVARALAGIGVTTSDHPGWLIAEPDDIRSGTGQPFRVFTPFWRRLAPLLDTLPSLPAAPRRLPPSPDAIASDDLDAWRLHPSAPDWSAGLAETWTPGEAGAAARLAAFVDDNLQRYAETRDYPALDGGSRLSPHLAFGEIAVGRVVAAVRLATDRLGLPTASADKFLSEIGWREFSWHLLASFPDLATANVQPAFDRFPWVAGEGATFDAWSTGRTGYPIVDAGMRELWRTGFMHNRVRMVTASFLVKHLLIDWRAGERWFRDTLVDADPASNPANWQWVAGSGADAAPYFRIFNPILQGETFDADGAYVRANVPELAGRPTRQIHKPTPAGLLAGKDAYPQPLVDHAEARRAALAAYAKIRGGQSG
jgi:deoxyribodipyrimidine photo-lyase